MPVQPKRLTLSVGVAAIAALALIVIKVNEARHVAWLHSATENALEQYVPEHPDDVKARVRLGVMEVANKDPRGEDLLKKAADASPGDEAIWFAYVDAIENPEVALAQIETYLKVLPDSVKLRAAKARRLAELGDPQSGLSLVDELIKSTGKDSDAFRARADALMLLRRVSEASESLKSAIALEDRDTYRLLLAMTLVPQQRFTEVRIVCLPVVKRQNRGAAEGHVTRAKLYLAGASLNLATPAAGLENIKTDLEAIIANSASLEEPERFLPYYFLGECELRLGAATHAIEPLKQAVRMAPQFPAALYSLARAMQASKEASVSSKLFRRHAQLTGLLSELDSAGIRLQEKPDDVSITHNLNDVQKRLEALLRQPLPEQ
ncbi:MAG: tetratricopeptide repeat protein [Armatimonadota bacterium]